MIDGGLAGTCLAAIFSSKSRTSSRVSGFLSRLATLSTIACATPHREAVH